MKAVFANKVIGELQAISYSVTREKAPIYTMGSSDPRSFSRGKRGIAGSLIFIVFDRHAVLESLAKPDNGLRFQSDVDDIRARFADANAFEATLSSGGVEGDAPGTVATQESELTSVGSDQELAFPWYVDQIPPFDITLAAANEYGALAVMRIFGVELLNEGYGVSIDDIVSEQQMTYVARSILPWQAVNSPAVNAIASQGSSSGS